MPQWIATTQFYLYGKKYCTKTGYDNAVLQREKEGIEDIVKIHDKKGDSIKKTPEKVFIITGANSGIGKEITKHLAKTGMTIYMFCRSVGRAETAQKEIMEETGNENVHVIVCDCGLESDVRRAFEEFSSHSGGSRLDGVVCNAGVLLNDPTPTKEGVETTFACHLLFGTYLLTSLAIPLLEKTEDSRVIVVSSGGIYNTKFPDINIASSRQGKYDGNTAYAYAKRGQVLLCEQWAKKYPKIKFASCHPGWARTDAVHDGHSAKYLEPMRTPLEGADGILWLCMAQGHKITSGAFYLDRKPCRKHLGGAFFTNGSFTTNTQHEIDQMMNYLEIWSNKDTRPVNPFNFSIDVKHKFMGQWYVWAVIPTMLEPIGLKNSMEFYEWNEEKQRVEVKFEYVKPKQRTVSTLLQQGTMDNENCTQWSLKAKLGPVFVPVPMKYIVEYCDVVDYKYCIVGVPDRSYLWIMARKPEVQHEMLEKLLQMAKNLGYDLEQIVRHEFDRALYEETFGQVK